jgi:hypothetical protein
LHGPISRDIRTVFKVFPKLEIDLGLPLIVATYIFKPQNEPAKCKALDHVTKKRFSLVEKS